VDESLWLTNRKQGAPARSDQIYYTIYRQGTQLCCAFYQSEKTVQLCRVKSASLHFSLFHWTVQGVTYWAQLAMNCTMPLSYTCSRHECNIKKTSGADHQIRETRRQ
jgi:hypothetical protein